MLHVVLLSPHSDPQAELGEPDAGGQCLYEHQLALALSSFEDVRVTTYCRFSGEREKVSKVNENYTVRRIEAGPAEFIPKEQIEVLLPEFVQKVHKELADSQQNETLVLHGHYWDGAKATLLLKVMRPDVPLLWTPHSLGSVKRESFPGVKQEKKYQFLPRYIWENYMVYSAHQVIVSTLQEKDIVSKMYQAEEEKIKIVPPGIDFNEFENVDKTESRRKYNLPQDANILLCLGRMSPSKGYHYAISVLEEMKTKKLDLPTYLVICGGPDLSKGVPKGGDAEYILELQKLVEEKNLQDYVLFHPAISHEEVKYMYRACDVFLMTSESEPFGLTLLEAMSLNRPVVAFNRGGPAHLIIHNQTGCLVKPKDISQMAGYVTALLKDVDYRSDITAQAFHFVRQNFDWHVLAHQFIEIYKQASEVSQTYDPFTELSSSSYFLQSNLGITK